MILRSTIVLMGLAVVGPHWATAQEPRLVGRLTAETRVQVDAMLDSARARALPIEPLVDRALEGASKRASGERIVAAVRRLTDELQIARDALGNRSTPSEITAGASALRAGATSDDLAQLRRLRIDRSLTIAAAVLADLVAVGVPADTAVAAVLALAEFALDTEYLALRQNVERDVALGASPVSALGVRVEAAAPQGDFGAGTQRPAARKP